MSDVTDAPDDDRALLAALEARTLAPAAFTHRAHVRAAWACLRDAPFGHAGDRFAAALRGFAAAVGQPGRYHETITWAYLALVRERAESTGAATFEAFAARNADVLDHRGGAIARLYPAETLASDLARRVFVLPTAR